MRAPVPDLALAAAAIAEAMGPGRPGREDGGAEPAEQDPFQLLGRWRAPGLDA